MNGRLERELKAEERMNKKLSSLPSIFTEFYYSMRASKKSYTTMDTYINYVKNFMEFITGNKIVDDFYKHVTSTDIEHYMISLETRKIKGQIIRTGDSIQATRWSALNTFFVFLVNKKEYILKNPMVKVERPKVNVEHKVIYMTKSEIKKVKNEIDHCTHKNAMRDKTIVGLALATGLRVSALIQINIEDIDFDNNIIRVIEKRQKTREIPFGENTKQLLKEWIEYRNKTYKDVSTTALFLSQKRNRISDDMVANLLKKYTGGINKHITPHKLRSTTATNLIKSGTPVTTVAKILGHDSIQTTMGYVGALNEETEKAIQNLDNVF